MSELANTVKSTNSFQKEFVDKLNNLNELIGLKMNDLNSIKMHNLTDIKMNELIDIKINE